MVKALENKLCEEILRQLGLFLLENGGYLKYSNEVGPMSFPRQQAIGQERVSGCSREGLGWLLGKKVSTERAASIRTGCPASDAATIHGGIEKTGRCGI